MDFELEYLDNTINNGICMLDQNFTIEEESILDKEIGSMIVMGFEGKYIQDPNIQKIASYLEKDLLGGLILFRHNIESSSQLQELTEYFSNTKKDVFISVDQEGGRVQRLSPAQGFQGFPSPASVASKSIIESKKIYHDLSLELRNHGINLNFAPVVDINNSSDPCPVIGSLDRSFSDDPSKVVEYAESFITKHNNNNVLTAIKHFPGHGLANDDSHLGLVDVTTTAKKEELIPFYKLIEQNKVDMIMTAHIINKNLDPIYPATLSPIILKKLLKEKGYEGVVVSDDLHMGAIASHYSLNETIILAINAGCDIMVFSNNPSACKNIKGFAPDHDLPLKIIDIVKNAVKTGLIDPSLIHDSYTKIQNLKKKIQL